MGAALPWHAVAAALIEGLQDPACVVDATAHRVVAANSGAEMLFNADRGTLRGRPVLELAAAPEDFLFWADAQTEGLDSETLVRGAAGGLRAVHRRISHLRWAAGAAACFLVQWQDRSGQRRAEAEHAQRLAQLNATLEATADGILVTDAVGRIVNFNRRFATFWELPAEALQRGNDDTVFFCLQRRVADPAGYMRRLAAIDEASVETTRDTLVLADGRRIERISLPQRSGGETVGRVWSFRALESDTA